MVDILEVPAFLDPASLQQLREELDLAAGAPATLLSREAHGIVRSNVRRTTRLNVAPQTRDRLLEKVRGFKAQLEAYFGQPLGDCEEPQFLRYDSGDFFVAHQDGNTPMIYDQSRFRRVTAVLFVSTPADEPGPHCYAGGAIVFHGAGSESSLRLPLHPPAGTLVAFRAETTHEVTPVTGGRRHTIAFWFRAPDAGA